MSGNVVPATGDVQFLSNASSNAVCQVFGLATTNVTLSSLVGRPYNPSVTAAPVFTAPTVRALPLSLQRDLSGASLFMATPNNPTIGGLDTNNQGIYPFYSGTTGATLRYYIALGTSAGTSNILSWRDVSINTWNYLPANTFTRDAKYYLSAVLSNINNGRKSLAISNTSDYGQPIPPTITFTITNASSWSITWTESSTVTIPTIYYWYIYKSDYSVLIDSGNVSSSVRSVNGTTTLAYDTDYIAVVSSIYSTSTGDAISSVIKVPLGTPVISVSLPTTQSFTFNSFFDYFYYASFTASWAAVGGCTSYDVYIGGAYATNQSGTTYSFIVRGGGAGANGSGSGTNVIVRGKTAAGTYTAYSNTVYVGNYTNTTIITLPITARYKVNVQGGKGGNSADNQAQGGIGTLVMATTDSAINGSCTFNLGTNAGGYESAGSPGGGFGGGFGGDGGGFSRLQVSNIDIFAGGGGGAGWSGSGSGGAGKGGSYSDNESYDWYQNPLVNRYAYTQVTGRAPDVIKEVSGFQQAKGGSHGTGSSGGSGGAVYAEGGQHNTVVNGNPGGFYTNAVNGANATTVYGCDPGHGGGGYYGGGSGCLVYSFASGWLSSGGGCGGSIVFNCSASYRTGDSVVGFFAYATV